MNRYISLLFCIIGILPAAFCQYSVHGRIVNHKNKAPIEFATVWLPERELWAITDEKGTFTLLHIPEGKIVLKAQCLGYARKKLELDIRRDLKGLVIELDEDNLKLDEVVVTAQKKAGELTTSYTMDRTTLDHAQILNITDIETLLPGGKTKSDNLTSDNRFSLRSGTSEKGNAAFGTAIEVDGVRLQNNAAMGETLSADTRNVSSANIESVEVITGIPSVEYGDLSNGMVKIHTRRGKTPFILELSTKPNTKQIALSKGLNLSHRAGVLNVGFDRTQSISDLASPHTSYDRNSLNLNYFNTFNKSSTPLTLTAGFTGNLGGYNSESDPDAFKNTYTKTRDYTFRGNMQLNWLLRKSWITNLSLSGSMAYSDKHSEENKNQNSSSSQPFIHSTQEGYFIATNYDENPNASIILGPTGYWYQLSYKDSKPIDYALKLKADWIRKFGNVVNRLMIGGDFTRNGNRGRGLFYDDMRYAPTWREYRYDELPYMNNFSAYIEEKVTLPVTSLSTFQLTAGLRSDMTFIKGSEYGSAATFSPRFNARYIFWQETDRWVSSLSMYGGWGKSVKLPSFEVLYPSPSYADKLAFAPGTTSEGNTYYAYYTIPHQAMYNPDLKWQYTQQAEIGIEAEVKGTRISLAAFRNRTLNPYMATNIYTPYSYNQTTQSSLESCPIPSANRNYGIDSQTGIVVVSDKTGFYPAQQLAYTTRHALKSNLRYTNGSPIERYGIDWMIDFAPISSLRTSIRLDGNYYYYKGLDETMIAWSPSSQMMTDGNPYKYIGYYVGSSSTSTSSAASSSVSNGNLSQQVNTNLTVTTHIPKLRLIVSMRVEASFYNYRRNLNEYSGGDRGFVIDDVNDNFGTNTNIYSGDNYVAAYPLYYTTWEDPDTKIPFAERFAWAKDNDRALYNELAKLVSKSNTNYYFNRNKLSSYFSANLSVTKEIGDVASISFYANNFFNNMKRVKSSQTHLETSLYNSSYIPKFYYGLSLRLKL